MTSVEEAEVNLGTYTSQLSAVESALTLSPSDPELSSLKNDLTEIISITEAELLNLKKNQLLASLEDDEKSDTDSGTEEVDSFVGMKCSIRYQSTWGTIQQQNCIILSVDMSDDAETTLRVLFLTPSSRSMLPCQQYLNSKCTFDNCRYSHGHVVKVSDLCEYQEPCFESFTRGKRCLCKNDDELWVPGTVTSVSSDRVFAKVDGSGVELTLTYDDVFPLSATADNDSDSDVEITDPSSVRTLTGHLPKVKASQSVGFGSWEEHTNSFGSKMLFKMGYRAGKGLGPRGEGILEPIEADVIPAGISLDSVRELRQKRLIRTVYKLNCILKKRVDHKIQSSTQKLQKSSSMFTMIDQMMKSKAAKPAQKRKPISKVSEKTVRVKSVNIGSDIIKCKKRLADLKKSLGRNRNDRSHCSRVQAQVDSENKKLESLLSKQRSVESELSLRNDKKKLKIF